MQTICLQKLNTYYITVRIVRIVSNRPKVDNYLRIFKQQPI